MREPRAEMIAFMIDEHLRLVLEAPKRRGMHDAIAIALKSAAAVRRFFVHATAARTFRRHGIGSEIEHARPNHAMLFTSYASRGGVVRNARKHFQQGVGRKVRSHERFADALEEH